MACPFDESDARVQAALRAERRFPLPDETMLPIRPRTDRNLSRFLSPNSDLNPSILDVWSQRLLQVVPDFVDVFNSVHCMVAMNRNAMKMMLTVLEEPAPTLRLYTDKLIKLGYLHRHKIERHHVNAYGKAMAFAIKFVAGDQCLDVDQDALTEIFLFCIYHIIQGTKKGPVVLFDLDECPPPATIDANWT